MSKKIRIADLPEFDVTEYLDDEQAVAEYLTIVIEENDPAALAQALGTVARARGMTEIAKASGMTREALYKALRADAQPRYETVAKVLAARAGIAAYGTAAGCLRGTPQRRFWR